MDKNNSTSFCLQPFSDLKGYMAMKNGQDKSEYSPQELLKVIQDSFKIVDEIKNMIWSQNRRGNSGVSWDHSSQKIFHIPQKILHCDLRIPESRESFPGLVLKDIIHTEATRDIQKCSHLTEQSVISKDAVSKTASDTDLPGNHTAVPTVIEVNMGHTAPDIRQASVTVPNIFPRNEKDNTSRPEKKRNVRTKIIDLTDYDTRIKQGSDVFIRINRKSRIPAVDDTEHTGRPPEVTKIILPAAKKPAAKNVAAKRKILRTRSQAVVDAVKPAPAVVTTHAVVAAHAVHGIHALHGTHAAEPDYTSTAPGYHCPGSFRDPGRLQC